MTPLTPFSKWQTKSLRSQNPLAPHCLMTRPRIFSVYAVASSPLLRVNFGRAELIHRYRLGGVCTPYLGREIEPPSSVESRLRIAVRCDTFVPPPTCFGKRLHAMVALNGRAIKLLYHYETMRVRRARRRPRTKAAEGTEIACATDVDCVVSSVTALFHPDHTDAMSSHLVETRNTKHETVNFPYCWLQRQRWRSCEPLFRENTTQRLEGKPINRFAVLTFII